MRVCRLCGSVNKDPAKEKLIEFNVEIEALLKRVNVFQLLEKELEIAESLPKLICNECLAIMIELEKYFVNVGLVQNYLKMNFKAQAEFLEQNEIGLADFEELVVVEVDLPFVSSDSDSDIDNGLHEREDVIELEQADSSKKDKKTSKKENVMDKLFGKELASKTFDFPVASLNVTDEELNHDSSLNELGLEHFGSFKWSQLKLSCQSCNIYFENNTEIKEHNRSIHNIRALYKCSVNNCQTKLQTSNAFILHMVKHFPNSKFCCWYCDIYYCDVAKLYEHLLKDHQHLQKICLYCGQYFRCSSQLTKHKERHYICKFSCKYCRRNFKSEKSLNIHLAKCKQRNSD